ncbi:YceD family protein [Pedobacter sp. AW31-3R]|uniref:YceD family protein n=1 Tax=Pedobacter sp. AW31-3R TaxID=3445781 RepID=UPI003FA087E0
MKPLKQYSIPFTGLKIGKHQFDFEIDNGFFDAFEYSLVKKGELKAAIELDKQETMLILQIHIAGTIELECDKCLSNFNAPVDIKERQIVKFAEDDLQSDDLEIIMLNKKESELDISEILYELINVSVPYIKICSQNGVNAQCDEEMIARLESLSGDAQHEQENNTSDPRWEALKKLK